MEPILRSDEEKELVWHHPEDQRKVVVKNYSEIFVKIAFYLQLIPVFLWKIVCEYVDKFLFVTLAQMLIKNDIPTAKVNKRI